MSEIKSVMGQFEVSYPNEVVNTRQHILNAIKDLTSTSNEVFKYLGQTDRIIDPEDFEKLTDAKIEQLIKNIIRETKTIK